MKIITIASPLHDGQRLKESLNALLKNVDTAYELTDSEDIVAAYENKDTAEVGNCLNGDKVCTYQDDEPIIFYIATGGTEQIFQRLASTVFADYDRPFLLLTSSENNSLAAAMEIITTLQHDGKDGEILHGDSRYIAEALRRINDHPIRLGIIGKPSDWLTGSTYDAKAIKEKLGVELVDIPLDELLRRYEEVGLEREPRALRQLTSLNNQTTNFPNDQALCHFTGDINAWQSTLDGATKIYLALRKVVADYQLSGFTVRCFDLLSRVKNTGCWALARLNAEGITAGCEGDVPAMLAMYIARQATGRSAFQANPAKMDRENNIITFAHCTIALDMVDSFFFDTHFESGIGIGICGTMQPQDVTIFKVDGALNRTLIAEGRLLDTPHQPNLCRTQMLIQPDDPTVIDEMLRHPIGNHHIIIPGRQTKSLKDFLHQ